MAWRGRSCIGIGRTLSLQLSGSHGYGKATLCSTAQLSCNFGQVRHKSGIQLPDIKEYVSPEAVSATIFSDWTPVLVTQDLLYRIHDLAGISWVSTIVVSTLGLRLLVGVPITVLQQRAAGRLQSLTPKVQQLVQDIRRETEIAKKLYSWNERKAKLTFNKAYKKHLRKLMEENNCHPLRLPALSLVQVAPWLTFSMALRNIAYMLPDNIPEIEPESQYRYMQLVVENTAWLDSLVAPDPFILPGIFVIANFINIHLATSQKAEVPQKTLQKVLPWVFRVVILGAGVVGTYLPSAVTLYWATSSVSAVGVNAILRLPGMKSVLGIPQYRSAKVLKLPSAKYKFLSFFKSKKPAV